MGALASVAKQDPEYLRRMIKKNKDGTYDVTFNVKSEKNGRTVWTKHTERVKPDFRKDGADPTPNKKPEIWAALIEKAYAQWKGGYEKAYDKGGYVGRMFEHITGKPTTYTAVGRTTTNADLAKVIRRGIAGDHPVAIARRRRARFRRSRGGTCTRCSASARRTARPR